MNQDIYFGMWGSLGKGSLSTGFGGSLRPPTTILGLSLFTSASPSSR
jgi:hypothetical protein